MSFLEKSSSTSTTNTGTEAKFYSLNSIADRFSVEELDKIKSIIKFAKKNKIIDKIYSSKGDVLIDNLIKTSSIGSNSNSNLKTNEMLTQVLSLLNSQATKLQSLESEIKTMQNSKNGNIVNRPEDSVSMITMNKNDSNDKNQANQNLNSKTSGTNGYSYSSLVKPSYSNPVSSTSNPYNNDTPINRLVALSNSDTDDEDFLGSPNSSTKKFSLSGMADSSRNYNSAYNNSYSNSYQTKKMYSENKSNLKAKPVNLSHSYKKVDKPQASDKLKFTANAVKRDEFDDVDAFSP